MNNANDGSGEGGAVEPQLYELLKLTATDNPPDLVLMTLGGNDSGFANVISGFIWTPTGKDVLEIRPAMEWATLTSRLASSYGHVNAVVNAPEAIAQRNGKVAQIVVLPYVRPVPAAGGDGCFVLVSSHELALANGFATSLNEAVRRRSSGLRPTGPRFIWRRPSSTRFNRTTPSVTRRPGSRRCTVTR